MKTVNENYPKNFEMSDEDLKRLAIQQMQANQVRQSNFPTEIISLPSEGLAYPESHPLSSGKIEMKYMTAREEDILTSPNLIKQGVVLDKLMQSMIISPVQLDDLIIGDKNAVMVAARILGYGKDYEIQVACPKCGAKNKVTIDLSKLPEINIPDTAIIPAPGIFEFTLPHSKRVIHFQLLTGKINKQIEKDLQIAKKSNKNDADIDRELTTRLKYLIVAVDGEQDRKFIGNFVDNELFAMDSRALRAYMKSILPDIKFEIENFKCTECEYESEKEALSFELDSNFFWPES